MTLRSIATVAAFLLVSLARIAPAVAAADGSAQNSAGRPPNIVFILADDQGVGDLGCYGSKHVRTPHIDRLAAEGTRFTDCYAGSAVCAPTRCALMTGLHTGHARRRDNEAKAAKEDFTGRPLVPLAADDVTVAAALKRAGYATGGFGKWGLGNPGTTGTPEKHGFDHFLGYLDQVHAHDYYTDHLLKDGQPIKLPGNDGKGGAGKAAGNGGDGRTYSHDVIAAGALDFVRQNKDRPFFLYGCFTLPHGNYVVPSDAPYSDQPWPEKVRNYAAMNTRLDETVGRIMALLKELKLDEDTVVFYSSDNGANPEFAKALGSTAGLRGFKRDLYEGGVRAPMIVRWPGRVPAGRTSDFVWSQVDVFATLCELAGVASPPKTDGVSVVPTLLGKPQPPIAFQYWEIYSPFQQAVRMAQWKGIRFGTKAPLELYDLSTDPAEAKNVAASHPEVVTQIEAHMAAAHTDTKYWPTREQPLPANNRRGGKGAAEKGED